MIQLIACDMDGTLLDSDKRLPQDLFPALRRLREQGVQFAVASGRQYASLRRDFLPVADDVIFICENGALVMRGGKRLFIDPMPAHTLPRIIAAARTLSDARKAAAKALEERILRELRELDMNKVRFSIDFTEHEPDATGIDTVRFLMSANAGEDLKPIHKIASGGELARIMLALKNVLAEQDHVMTMVFDEVDTGVSGRAAQRVAEKMAKLSRRRQMLCVTHLPQLAAMADTHFSVEKGEENGRTFTRVVELDRAQRCAELARLTGGAAATETQLRGAEELLSAADAFRSAL